MIDTVSEIRIWMCHPIHVLGKFIKNVSSISPLFFFAILDDHITNVSIKFERDHQILGQK